MSMYDACKYCGEPTVKPGFVACSKPEHRELVKIDAQLAFNASRTRRASLGAGTEKAVLLAREKEEAVLLAREAGLPEDYFLNQINPDKAVR